MILSLQIRKFCVYFRLKRAIKKHAVQQVNQKIMSEETGKYFAALQKDFDKVFEKVMKHNEK